MAKKYRIVYKNFLSRNELDNIFYLYYDALANCITELIRACDFGTEALGWLSLKYSLRFRGGRVLLSRSAINKEVSLSGEDERSGDSGDDLGGVSSRAASTQRTRFDDLERMIFNKNHL